jgi:hypothetical protein
MLSFKSSESKLISVIFKLRISKVLATALTVADAEDEANTKLTERALIATLPR